MPKVATPPAPGAPPPPPPPVVQFRSVSLTPRAPPLAQGPNLRKVYWDKLTVTQNTWWSDINSDVGALREEEKQAIVKSFEIRVNASKKALTEKPKHVTGMPTLIPIPRSNNIAIMLSRFPMSAEGIVEAIATGDPEGTLTLERLAVLLQCEPTEEELQIMQNFKGDATVLNAPERFLMDLATKVERLPDKIAALVYARQFPEMMSEAYSGLRAIEQACSQVREAEGFRKVLAVALRVGNFMNAGGPRSSTNGITLDSLHKLSDVRTTAPTAKGGCTLLDFVVELVDAREDGEISLTNELGACQAASRIARAELEGLIRKITSGAQRIKREIDKSSVQSFDGLLVDLDSDVEALSKEAERVDAEFTRFAELCGETRKSPEDVFASIWTFACACDASRAARAHRASKKK